MNPVFLLCQCDSVLTKACGVITPVVQVTNESGSNCSDVCITKTICCTLVTIMVLLLVGLLLFQLINRGFNCCSEKRKREWEVEDRKAKRISDLRDKRLAELKSNRDGYLNALEEYILANKNNE